MLVVKDKGKGGEVSNFGPIPCLHVPLMWKLFAGVLANTIEVQKGCRRNS